MTPVVPPSISLLLLLCGGYLAFPLSLPAPFISLSLLPLLSASVLLKLHSARSCTKLHRVLRSDATAVRDAPSTKLVDLLFPFKQLLNAGRHRSRPGRNVERGRRLEMISHRKM